MTTASATFKITGWDEDTYENLESPAKLTRANATQAFSGDIEGDGAVTWLMAYAADDAATFVGLLRITGQVGGRDGTVVLTSSGTFDGSVAKGPLTVLEGFGGLAGITGSGELVAPLAGEPSVTLEYELA
jgi:hypothetical protein